MDEKQLQLLWDSHAKNGGFKDYNEFKTLMNDGNARKVYFDDANAKLGFKDYGEFETILQVKPTVEKKNQVGSPLSVTQLPSGSSNGKLPSSYGLGPPKEQISTTDNLPSTSNLKLGATDARVGGDVFDQAPKSAKVIGGVYNTLVESAARIMGGLGTMAQDLSAPVNTDLWTTPRKQEERAKFSEPQGEFRKAASGFIEKARLPVSSKEEEAKLGEFDVHKKTLGQNLAALAFTAPSMVADVMAGTATGGGTFILQGVNDADEEIEKNPDAQNLPEGVKMGYKYTAGLVNAALMKFNFDKVLHGTGVDKWVTKNITDKVVKGFIDAGIKATKEDIEAAVTKEVASLATKAKKVGLKTAVGALTGSGTGAAMAASHAGLHELVNLEEGKEVFDTKDIGNDILNSAANLGLFSAITGGAGALRGGKEAEAKSPETIEEPKPTTEVQKETPTVESAVIEIGGKTYEGKNHAEAILKAKEDGQDISQVDRKAEGKFKLSDGTIIDRAEAKQKFGQDRSELLIPQDEAAKQADKDYEKQKSVPEGGGEVKGDEKIPEGEVQIEDDGKVVPFSQVGKTKIMFDRANKKFTYQTPTGRESSPKQSKLAASRITPKYFKAWWREMATDEQKQQVRNLKDEMLPLLEKAQNYEYADDVETFLMRMIKDKKFHPSILKDLTDVSKSTWSTKDVDNIRKGHNLDTFVKETIGSGEDGLLAQEGFHGYDEKEVMEMIKDIIRKYPNGIKVKDINDRVKEDNPLHELERLEDEFIDKTGLDINKALEIYEEEKHSLDKRQTEVQAPTETSKKQEVTNEQETIPKGDTENKQIQLQAEEKSQSNEPTIETTPPTEPPKGEAAVVGKGDSNKVGVSHSKLTELSEKMGLKEPERGEYLSPQWYADRGRKLLQEGADPNEVDNPNNTLHDRISIARAHLENLVKASDEIAKHNPEGVNSEAYKEASKEVSAYAEKVKGLGTEAHRAMTSLQGERDIDTDSFTAVKRTLEDDLGKPASKEQEKKIHELTNQNQKLKEQTQELEKKLIEATDKAVKESSEKQTPKEKSKSIADKIRQAKIHRPGLFSAATPASIVWDASVEVVAKTVEAGGKIVDAIQKGIKYMQATDWYKKLNDADKKEAEKQFKDWHEDNGIDTKEKEFEEKVKSGAVRSKAEKPLTDAEKILEDEKELKDLQQKFVNKQGNKFSIDEAKDIWEYGKKNYTDKGVSYRDMLINVSNDLGLSWKQVSEALTSKKVKPISDAMWKKSSDYRRSQIATKNWVEAQNKSLPFKWLRKVSAAFRGVAVFGHGGIFIGTHAGMTLFNPSQWHVVIPAFIRGWKFAYGNRANYERRIEQLKNSPNYVLAQRAGLKNNPDMINTEEFQKSQEIFKKIGGEAGVKGFNAIKVLRQDLFDYHYNRLSEVEKNDAEAVKQIARLVNNATAATNLKLPEWVNETTFAGGMEAARWGKLTRNPMRATAVAVKALIKPESATTAERVFAKVWARRVGEQLATMTAMLAANAALQYAINPKNPVNLTNPNKPDYLKFKFGDITIDPTSGMRGAAMFAYGLGKIPFKTKKELRGDTRTEALGKSVAGYARGKFAPFYSTLWDFFSQSDFNRNPMPFSEDKPTAGHHKLTWPEYAWEKAPLPMAHAAQDMYHSALDNGADKITLNHVLDGIIAGGISGGTGFRVGEYDAEESNHSPFTDEDKKDPTFKYFIDKGLELPNTALSSEEITNEKNKTKKTIADYPKETQEKYTEEHKKQLKHELSDIKKQGYVYVKTYKKSNGDTDYDVSVNKPTKGNSVKKNIDSLSKEELAQVLHIAQSKATTEAKKKIKF